MIVTVHLSADSGKIIAATTEAGDVLNLAYTSSELNPQLDTFLKLAAQCQHDPTQRPEWRSRDGRTFTLANIGMSLPGEPHVVLLRMTPARNNAPGTSGFWRSALQFGLTSREATVFDLLASGASDKKIGEAMNISQHTARSHIRNIYRKLGVAGRVEAIGKILKQPEAPKVPSP